MILICIYCKGSFNTDDRRKKTCGRACFKLLQASSKWQGTKISYDGIHMRLYRMFGKAKFCSHCGKGKKFEWANVNGDYTDVKNFIPLCISCHRNFDFERRKNLPPRIGRGCQIMNCRNKTHKGARWCPTHRSQIRREKTYNITPKNDAK